MDAMLSDFKKFLLRGSVIDLAVGVVMGAAFGAVVTACVKDLLTPLIAAVVGKPDFSALHFSLRGTPFPYGDALNAVVSFLLIGTAVYFFVVLPVNRLMARYAPAPPPAAMKDCPECLGRIPAAARRCMHCTSVVGSAAGA